jgi:hypothetical protein
MRGPMFEHFYQERLCNARGGGLRCASADPVPAVVSGLTSCGHDPNCGNDAMARTGSLICAIRHTVRQRVETMGIRPLKQGSSSEERLSHLLYELCVDWGFCIPLADAQRIASTKTLTAEQFAHAVLIAEGFVPEYESWWFKKIRQRFVGRFGREIRAEN